jgi:GrpB-like predicted nucleotidyltransferase (UPF0157 family)
MVNKDDEQWGHYLAFRDYLREHPQLRSEYDAVKRTLAKRFPADREAYTNGKVRSSANCFGSRAARSAVESVDAPS